MPPPQPPSVAARDEAPPAGAAAAVVFARDDIVQPYSAHEGAWLTKRRGGGGRGGGGSISSGSSSRGGSSSSSSSGSRGGTSSSSSGGSASSAGSKGFTPGTVNGGNRVYGSSSSNGIATPYRVNSGAFSGRQAGGATRSSVYGSSMYGSGYPSGYTSRNLRAGGGVGGLGFPFVFWPLTFGSVGYYGSREYRDDASERPGGNVTQYTLAPPATVTDTGANQFALYGDANSVDATFQQLISSCQVGSTPAQNFTVNFNQAVQYYRGSSFALLLNGYNNTQPPIEGNGTDTGSTDATTSAPLPTSVDSSYLSCLNTTVGNTVPLIDDAANASSAPAAAMPGFTALMALIVVLFMQLLA